MSKATGRKRIGIGVDEATALAVEMIGKRISSEQVRSALTDGSLRGRNFGGSVGWVTTARGVEAWIRTLLNEPPLGGAA